MQSLAPILEFPDVVTDMTRNVIGNSKGQVAQEIDRVTLVQKRFFLSPFSLRSHSERKFIYLLYLTYTQKRMQKHTMNNT